MSGQNNNRFYIDPVCKMEVAKSNNMPSFKYHANTYYFCAEDCRKAFISAPDKYLLKKPAKRKGLWARYLGRLNKATGGRPPCCH
jgi:YHS domain-containing protein